MTKRETAALETVHSANAKSAQSNGPAATTRSERRYRSHRPCDHTSDLERRTDLHSLAKLRHERCRNDEATIAKALEGNYRSEHVFTLRQSVELYDFYQEKMEDCDKQIEKSLSKFETPLESFAGLPR